MSQSVSVLLLDDGELDDIQRMLEQMQIPFGRVRGASIVPGMGGPTDLLIATPRRINAVRDIQSNLPDDSAPVRIVVASEDSTSLRSRLRNVGFDYLVRRPVHQEALRLLVLHSLYTGEERRYEPRIPMGYEIAFRSGLRQRRGILADLSTRGCRLLVDSALEDGKRLRIEIPDELGTSEPLSIRGHVIWSRFDAAVDGQARHVVAVMFEKLPTAVRNELEWILEERAKGPARLSESPAPEEVAAEERGIRELPTRNLRKDPRFEPDVDTAVEIDSDPVGRVSEPVTPRPQENSPQSSEPGAPDVGGSTAEVGPAPAEENASPVERRTERRAAFEAKVPAFCSRALRVLVGRDLTAHGMRVEASPELALGDRLHLAIYGEPGEEPFLVWAKVARDDLDQGVMIEFDPLHAVVARQLEKLVASLPAVESLQDGEIEAMGTVISEILPDSDG
ncbi:MAG: PilZ domain-containing protein [Myxococcota bacterium]